MCKLTADAQVMHYSMHTVIEALCTIGLGAVQVQLRNMKLFGAATSEKRPEMPKIEDL